MDEKKSINNFNKIKNTIVILSWISALIFFTYIFQKFLDNDNNPNKNPESNYSEVGVNQVILKRNRQGHYVSNGFINEKPIVFLLDTGATDVAIPQEVAQTLKLSNLGKAISQTANGSVVVYRTNLKNVRLGSIKLTNVSAVILPTLSKNTPVLLGMSFLKQVELIQKDNLLTLRQFK